MNRSTEAAARRHFVDRYVNAWIEQPADTAIAILRDTDPAFRRAAVRRPRYPAEALLCIWEFETAPGLSMGCVVRQVAERGIRAVDGVVHVRTWPLMVGILDEREQVRSSAMLPWFACWVPFGAWWRTSKGELRTVSEVDTHVRAFASPLRLAEGVPPEQLAGFCGIGMKDLDGFLSRQAKTRGKR